MKDYSFEGIYDEKTQSPTDRAKVLEIETRHQDATLGEWNNYFSWSSPEIKKALADFDKNQRQIKRKKRV